MTSPAQDRRLDPGTAKSVCDDDNPDANAFVRRSVIFLIYHYCSTQRYPSLAPSDRLDLFDGPGGRDLRCR